MSTRNRFYREPDWKHVCDWTQEQFDAEEATALRQLERNEKGESKRP